MRTESRAARLLKTISFAVAMRAKPDLRVLLKWMITRSGSAITDVMLFNLT